MKKILFIFLLFILMLLKQYPASVPPESESEIKAIVSQVSPSIVKVVSENAKRYIATGIVMDSEHVLSSLLIANHPFQRIYVETVKKEAIPVKIVGQDAQSGIILLRLENRSLAPIRLSEKSGVGDWVLLIGAFYNQFPAVYKGFVSTSSADELILNAPVAPGAAGGAVVNASGELVGVIRGKIGFSIFPNYTYKDYSSEIVVTSSHNGERDLCYAVPSVKIKDLFVRLKKFGRISRGWLGVSLADDMPRILEISKDSPAKKSGIQEGDIILEIDGRRTVVPADVTRAVRAIEPGKKIALKVNREGKALNLTAEIGQYRGDEGNLQFASPDELQFNPPEMDGSISQLPQLRNLVVSLAGSHQLGIDVYELTLELAEKYSIKEGYGLLVSRIAKESAAEKGGLKVGDILVRAGQSKINQLGDLRWALESLKDKEPIALEFYREGQLKKLSVVPDTRKNFIWEMDNFKDRLSELYGLRKAETQAKTAAAKASLLEQQAQAKFSEEMKKIQAENRKLLEEIKRKYESELKRLQSEIEELKKKKDD